MANLDSAVSELNNGNVVEEPIVNPIVLDSLNTTITPYTISSTSESSEDDTDDHEEEWTNTLAVPSNNVLPAGSIVQIKDSTDVVIGPLTRFHGPVNIYQNIQATSPTPTDETPASVKDDSNNVNKKPTKKNGNESSSPEKRLTFVEILEKTSAKRLLLYSIIALSIFIIVAFGIILSLKKFTHVEDNDGKTYSYKSIETDRLIKNHTIYSRESWGGEALMNGTQPLNLPVEYVIIAHTAGSFCHSFTECSKIVKNMQTWQKPTGFEIRYNFLIGGDGGIYVGKGWDVMSFSGKNSITVSFMGNFMKTDLTPTMISALKELLQVGVDLKKLRTDYKVVCHNQTQNTFSPGAYVFEKVAELPHFYSGPVRL